jgi:hypothetical protein
MLPPSVWDFALGVAIATFVLKVLDVFLSDAQKAWLDNRTLRAWHWLAEAKQKSLLNWLQDFRPSIAWAGVVIVAVYMTWAFEKAVAPPSQVITVAILIAAVGLWFGLRIIRVILAAPTLSRAVVRATVVVVITILPAVIFFGVVYTFSGDLIGLAKSFAAAAAAKQMTLGLAPFALFFLVVLILCVHLTVIALIFWTVVAVPLLAVYLLTVALFSSEFVVRRIAEYPKGPILAGSALFGALAGVFRILSGGH